MKNETIQDIFNIKLFPVSLNFWKESIDYLFSLKEQLLDTQIGFSKRKENAIQTFSKRVQNDLENKYDHELDLTDELYSIDKIYPEIVYNSMFIYAYSFLEISLKKLKQIIEHDIVNKKKNLSANNYKYLKAKEYIEQETGIDLSQKKNIWNELNSNYREVRNAIVHNASNADKKVLQDYLKDNDQFVYDEISKDFHIKSHEFIFIFIEFCEEYLNFIYDQLSKINENMYN